ncbi:MAG: hypothetical protein KH828_03370 [Clostridiales bacterium]|nr:hypothetical protein [Clostridiales bacterium]
MKEKCALGSKGILLAALLVFSRGLLGADGAVFLRWWMAALLLGAGFLPVTGWLFQRFRDKGWVVSKVLGIAAAGFFTWFLVSCRVLPFTGGVCVGIPIAIAAVSWGFWFWKVFRKKSEKEKAGNDNREGKWLKDFLSVKCLSAVLDGELVFTLFFLIWTYFAGFRPAAYGTEKFMDYGFMMAMMRSTTLPAKDLWYAGGNLNYYYGGQYFAVYLTKLTGTQVAQTYNLMRTLVAGFGFALPFVLVRQMILDIRNRGGNYEIETQEALQSGKTGKNGLRREILAVLGGIFAGAGVSLAGNMHYVVVGKILPWAKKILGLPEGDYKYWFPNSTRYIGYYPAENDKTIHEFPSYSFVLGDLHAHVANVMFVLAVICLIYAMVQNYRAKLETAIKNPSVTNQEGTEEKRSVPWKQMIRETLMEPYVLVFSFFIGLFHWTNYWDFVIYFVMGGLGVIYCNFLRFHEFTNGKQRACLTAAASAIHAVWVFLLGSLFALPFTLQFETMVSGIALAQNHSRPYQWWLIWGLPFLFTLLLFWRIFRSRKPGEILPEEPDFFSVILGFSAIGLILIPEIVYVRDIYEKEYARSNTMFKLTYQAFLMFGIVMGYGFVRMWLERKQWLQKALTTVGFLCFAGCCCYIGTAVHSWFGPVWETERYQGLDATAFLETSFSEDASAIRWLNENVEGSPVVLEAHGDSYSDYERVSAMTGLPTILGWYVHEWLWRGGIEELNQRVGEVEAVYTSNDRELVERILEDYEVAYIFVGKMEREKYSGLNEEMLQSLGNVVYRDEGSQTYIVQVGNP